MNLHVEQEDRNAKKKKQKLTGLSYNDLMFLEGKKDEIFGQLLIKLSQKKDEWNKCIAPLFKKSK